MGGGGCLAESGSARLGQAKEVTSQRQCTGTHQNERTSSKPMLTFSLMILGWQLGSTKLPRKVIKSKLNVVGRMLNMPQIGRRKEPAKAKYKPASWAMSVPASGPSPTKAPTRVQGPPNGGVSNGGVSRSRLVLPFLSFFVLFGTFPIFPGFSRVARGWSGDFPDSSLFAFSAY